jgi:hypothetical protein
VDDRSVIAIILDCRHDAEFVTADLKTTTATISVMARFQPRAWTCERAYDIDPDPALRRGPFPRDGRPMRPADGRNHRAGKPKRRHVRVADPFYGLMASG